MKILQLCKKFPYPLKDGESVAVTYLSRALHQLGCQLDLLAMNTTKHYIQPNNIPEDFDHYRKIVLSDLDNRIKAKDALFNLFTSDSYHVVRYISKDYKEKLIQLLKNEDYDIVQLETLYLAPYVSTIRQHSKAQIAMRSHNVESEIWERIAKNTRFGLKKWYVNLLANRLRNFELSKLNAYDMMIAITERDLQHFRDLGCHIASHATPIGLEMQDYPRQQLSLSDQDQSSKNPVTMPLSLCFIGSLDWMPNLEGLTWFLENVWPEVYSMYPDLTLHIAGRNTPNWLLQKAPENVVIHGEVEDALSFITDHPIMIVPLFSGSGMRVKILESMALSRITITTSIGLEGINATPDKEVLIADDKAAFIAQIRYCYEQQQNLSEMGKQARLFIENNFDNVRIAEQLLSFYNRALMDFKLFKQKHLDNCKTKSDNYPVLRLYSFILEHEKSDSDFWSAGNGLGGIDYILKDFDENDWNKLRKDVPNWTHEQRGFLTGGLVYVDYYKKQFSELEIVDIEKRFETLPLLLQIGFDYDTFDVPEEIGDFIKIYFPRTNAKKLKIIDSITELKKWLDNSSWSSTSSFAEIINKAYKKVS